MSIPALHRRIKSLSKTRFQSGKILSFTVVRHPPEGFGTEPYTVGLLELEDGSKVCAQLITNDLEPEIGMTVLPRMRRIRTLENGLHVNDLKYELAAVKPEPVINIRAYVLAITGPSGVGKSTVSKSLLHLFHAYSEQVPVYATRKRQKSDVDPLITVNDDKFEQMVTSGEIIAHTEVSADGRTYRKGYRQKDIDAVWSQGKLPIVVTDVRLLEGLAAKLGRRAILSCGLLPPGQSRRHMLSALLHRLRHRGQHTDVQIQERLLRAEVELKAFKTHPNLFDHMLVNDKLETCLESIREIVKPA